METHAVMIVQRSLSDLISCCGCEGLYAGENCVHCDREVEFYTKLCAIGQPLKSGAGEKGEEIGRVIGVDIDADTYQAIIYEKDLLKYLTFGFRHLCPAKLNKEIRKQVRAISEDLKFRERDSMIDICKAYKLSEVDIIQDLATQYSCDKLGDIR